MNKRLAGIYLIMREFGGFNIDDLEKRVILQKTIYLTQILGLDLRFRFNWYIHGPYSPDLTTCAFELNEDNEAKDQFKELPIRIDVKKRIEILKDWLKARPTDLKIPKWLELISSIHYVKNIHYAPNDITRENIKDRLRESGKDDFTSEQISSAWSVLESADLIRDRKLSPP